jgi:nitroreductase
MIPFGTRTLLSEAIMHKPAESKYALHDLIRNRWSPYALSPKRIEPAVLGSLFEAARWAPSSYNEQPWCFVLATQDHPAEFARLLGCLVEFNQGWAKNAYALAISCAKLAFDKNGKPNRHAYHDVGMATQNLFLQAEAHGLHCHGMAGFDEDKARSTLQIPDTHDPVAAIAIGYHADDLSKVDAKLVERDQLPRTRKALRDCVYTGAWGQNATL